MTRAIAAAAMFLILALAGCSAKVNRPDASSGAPAPDDAGILEGLVTTNEYDPVAGVHLALGDASADPVTTDDAGRFRFSAVPAGRHILFAAALGYESLARNVDVAAGETTSLRLELNLLSTTDPFSVVQSKKGFIACGSGLGTGTTGGMTQVSCGAADPNQAFLFNYAFGKNLAGVIFEMSWRPTQALSRDLVLIVEKDGCDFNCGVDDTFAEVQGCCYLRVTLPVANLTKDAAHKPATDFAEKSGRIQTRTFPAFSDDAAASVFTSQEFFVYVEYFYNGLPADFESRTNVPSA